jgi:hypothetical protein
MVAGMASMAWAADPKKKTETKGEKPKPSPGWVIVEEDWGTPFYSDFSNALHKAREHYRAKEERSAGAEIDKAISWLKYAQNQADKTTSEDLDTACSDLSDCSTMLKSGKQVLAAKLDISFANASKALAQHHYFKSAAAVADGDMKCAGTHLMAAADLVRSAARSANIEYGNDVVDIYNNYAPFGYWDDTVVFEKSKLESNLTSVRTELERLATKLKASK